MGAVRPEWAADGPGMRIWCVNEDCPRPSAAHEILCDDRREHEVTFTKSGFTLWHPLKERLDDALMACDIHSRLAEMDGPPPAGLGKYQVTLIHDPWDNSDLSVGLMLNKLGD